MKMHKNLVQLIKTMIAIDAINLDRQFQPIKLSMLYEHPRVLHDFCVEMHRVISPINPELLVSVPLSSSFFVPTIAMRLNKPFVEPAVAGRMRQGSVVIHGKAHQGQKAVILDGIFTEGELFQTSFIVAQSAGIVITHAVVFCYNQQEIFSGVERFLQDRKVTLIEVAPMKKIRRIWDTKKELQHTLLAA